MMKHARRLSSSAASNKGIVLLEALVVLLVVTLAFASLLPVAALNRQRQYAPLTQAAAVDAELSARADYELGLRPRPPAAVLLQTPPRQ